MTSTPTYDIAALKAKYMPNASGDIGNESNNLGTQQNYDIKALREQYLGSSVLPDQKTISEDQKAAEESKATYKPTFGVNADDSSIVRAAKVVGNIPGSAFNFVKGALGVVNPVNIYNNYKDIFSAIPEIASTYKYRKQLGESPVLDLGGDVAKSAYTNIVPEAGRKIVSAIGNSAEGKSDNAYTDLMDMSNAISNDPVGQILPFLLTAQGGTKAIDKIKNTKAEAVMKNYVDNIGENVKNGVPIPDIKKSNLGGTFDKTIETIASPVTKPSAYIFGKAKEISKNTAEYATAQLTGLDKSTLKTAMENPKIDFSKINRQDLGREIQSKIDLLSDQLETTGKEYKPIRASKSIVEVTKTDLLDMIKEQTGLELKNGKFQTSSKASIRDARDVRGIQHFYDTHQSTFNRGKITAEEFLNIRQDLGKLSKFEREIGRSGDLENVSKGLYSKLNSKYRKDIVGLEELDAQFGPLKEELRNASKGLVDSEGNLTDTGLTKIARVTENRPNLAAQLEKISPGFMERVKLLQAAEDLRAAADKHKVGTYGRAIGQGGVIAGLATMNPLIIGASIAQMLITNPSNAIKLIQKYGKSKEVVNAAIGAAKQNPKLKEFVQDITTKPLFESESSKSSAFAPKPKIPEIKEPKIKTEPKVTKDTNTSNLIEEAKKYKSADEFVKAQKKNVYRTEQADSAYRGKAVWGDGRYFGIDKNQVKEMTTSPHTGKSTGGKVDEYFMSPNLKIKEIDISWDAMSPEDFNKFPRGNDLRRQILREGYDGVILKTGGDLNYGGDQLIMYKNVDQVKTKSQLTDIWNEANNKKGAFSPKQTVK